MLWPRGLEDCVEGEWIEVSKPLEEVGVIGLVTWLDVGESFCSFVRIFFRNPSVGIGRDRRGGQVAIVEVGIDEEQAYGRRRTACREEGGKWWIGTGILEYPPEKEPAGGWQRRGARRAVTASWLDLPTALQPWIVAL